MNFIPVRKILRCLGIYKKRDRSLHDPTDIASQKYSESTINRRWIIFMFVISGIWLFISQYRSAPKQYIIYNVPKGSLKSDDFEDFYTENYSKYNSTMNSTNIPSTTTQGTQNHDEILIVKNITKQDNKIHYFVSNSKENLPFCSYHLDVNSNTEVDNSLQPRDLHSQLSSVLPGGYYYPQDCRSRHKVAILVPYRKRETNLAVFAFKMHPFLMRQKLEYRIFVIEQAGDESFNRGCLFNVGFKEMLNYNDWHCVVFHDVDLLPLDDRILYTCPTFPRHMCATVKEKENLSYNKFHTLFGGVSSMSVKHFKAVNGYSNAYWGWGGEDNDLFWRVHNAKLPVVRYNKTLARYTALPHIKQFENRDRYHLLHKGAERCKTDGLSNLVYTVILVTENHLYTHILVDINAMRNVTNKNK